jgi:HEPN superfamily RES-like protein
MSHYDDCDSANYSSGRGTFVCGDCANDPALKHFVDSNATGRKCSYCGRKTARPSCVPIDKLVQRIFDRIQAHYDMPENELGRDDGEWIGETMDTSDLLDGIGFNPNEWKLFEHCAEAGRDSASS